MAHETRQLLLESGERLMIHQGYAATGIQDILKAAQVPKGSFYHFFESKEQFGLAVLERYACSHDHALRQHLGDTTVGPLERLRRYFGRTLEHTCEQKCRDGCLLGNLSQEMAASVEIFRQTLNGIWNTWAATIAGCIREAQALGEVERSVDAERAADALIEGWQGALIRAKLARDLGPLRGFVGYTLPTLLGLAPVAAPQPEEPR